MTFAASSLVFLSVIFIPDKNSVSGMFGVSRETFGYNFSYNIFLVVSSTKTVPLVEIITGSATTFLIEYFSSYSAIISACSFEAIIPIFTASGFISVKMLFICFLKNSAGTGIIPVIPTVFCAVSAVIQVMAYTL